VQVDAVEEGAGQAGEVVLALAGSAAADLDGGAAAAARVGGGDELEARGEAGGADGASHGAILEGLTQGFERPGRELRQLIQERTTRLQ
jgi:hypothetical protein